MSDPGLSLDQYQQLQDMQRRQQMAAMLMGGNAGQQNAANGGLANVGSMIAGAALASRNQTDQQNLLNQMRYAATPDKPVALGQMPGANGGSFDLGNVNAKTPLIQSKYGGLANLFSFGGGS